MTVSGNNINSMKRDNRSAVLTEVRRQGSVSRTRLAESLQLTPAAITKIVGNLIEEGLLTESGSLRAGAGTGRSQILLEINADARAGLGVMLNIDRAILSAVRLDGSLIFSEEVPVRSPCDPEETVAALSSRLLVLAGEHGLGRQKVTGLGIAVRGMVDRGKRVLTDGLGLFTGRDIPLADMFETAAGFPVVMENNVRSLLTAQIFLDRDGQNDCQFLLRCEYGIGGALSINDEIWSGGKGHCSEIGHIQVVRRGGAPCACGKTGCLETIASPYALRSQALSILDPKKTPLMWALRGKPGGITLSDVLDCASRGDAGAARIVSRGIRALGQALKSAVYIIDPQRIILYGDLFEHPYYLTQLLAEMSTGQDKDHAGIPIGKSAWNNLLDPVAAGILSINRFLADGGGIPQAMKREEDRYDT